MSNNERTMYGVPEPELSRTPEDPLRTQREEQLTALYDEQYDGIKSGAISKQDYVRAQVEKDLRNESLAERDPLTRLYNRRGFFHVFDPQLREHIRILREKPNTTAGSIIKVDLDNFGVTNKVIGEHEGDRVLENVSATLTEVVRPGDLVARFGGEEFTIFAPWANLEDAVRIAERARIAIPQRVRSRGINLTQTASFGIRQLPDNLTGEQLSELRFREGIFSESSFVADVAMRQAKREGRDGIIVVMNDGSIMRATAEEDPTDPSKFIVRYHKPTPTNLTIPIPNLRNIGDFQSWMERHITEPFNDYRAFPDPLGATRKQILDIVQFKLERTEPLDDMLKMVLNYAAQAS